jgi:hypothetical protein
METRTTIHYHHRQTNLATPLIFAAIAAVAIAGWMLFAPTKLPVAILIGPLAIAAIAVAIFSTFTTTVTASQLIVAFGLGIMRRRVALADIVRAERTSVPWWYGIGVKFNPGFITYMVASGPAVAITQAKGMAVRIATDDADALLAALAQAGVRTD